MPVANVSYAGLALKAGINKDAARVGLNEILQKLGHYAGNLRDSARIQFFDLGTLVCSQGFARFRAGGNRGLGHSRSVQQIRPSSSSHIAPRAAVQAVRLARVVCLCVPGSSLTFLCLFRCLDQPSPLASIARHVVAQPHPASARGTARAAGSARRSARRSARPVATPQQAQRQQASLSKSQSMTAVGRSALGQSATQVWGASQDAVERAGVDPALLSSYNRRPLGQAKPVSQKDAMAYNKKMAEDKKRREAAARREVGTLCCSSAVRVLCSRTCDDATCAFGLGSPGHRQRHGEAPGARRRPAARHQ